jgi:hypothetical protein
LRPRNDCNDTEDGMRSKLKNAEYGWYKDTVEVRIVFASHGVRKDEDGAMREVIV